MANWWSLKRRRFICLTPALHYGAAVFEGIRAYNTPTRDRRFFACENMQNACSIRLQIFGIRDLPFTVDDVVKAVKDTVQRQRVYRLLYPSVVVFEGRRWNLNVDAGKPALAIAVWQWSNYLGEEALAKGIRAKFPRTRATIRM